MNHCIQLHKRKDWPWHCKENSTFSWKDTDKIHATHDFMNGKCDASWLLGHLVQGGTEDLMSSTAAVRVWILGQNATWVCQKGVQNVGKWKLQQIQTVAAKSQEFRWDGQSDTFVNAMREWSEWDWREAMVCDAIEQAWDENLDSGQPNVVNQKYSFPVASRL